MGSAGASVIITDGKGVRTLAGGARTLKELLEWNQDITFEISRDVLKEEQNRGFDKKARVRTDTIFDRGAHYVKPFGKIEYYARQAPTEALLAIYDRLKETSVVGKTRHYTNSHIVVVNGKQVAKSRTQLKNWLKKAKFEDRMTIRFVNAMPYARKLELYNVRMGKSGVNFKQSFSKKRSKASGGFLRKPNGTYYRTYVYARRKFKVIGVRLQFQFLPGNMLGLDSGPYRPGYRTHFKDDKDKEGNTRAGRPYLYPAITVVLDERGITQ